MGKSVNFDSCLLNKLVKDPAQAVDYLKLAIEKCDFDLLRLSLDNLIEAGYSSYTITPIDFIEQASVELKQQSVEAKI